ncbi:hypothetical protein Bbelb_327830 [Branchiostoma belcheri]|nr:hypothetical protein Bbelb_327830 [Branchiostoma belcheri]
MLISQFSKREKNKCNLINKIPQHYNWRVSHTTKSSVCGTVFLARDVESSGGECRSRNKQFSGYWHSSRSAAGEIIARLQVGTSRFKRLGSIHPTPLLLDPPKPFSKQISPCAKLRNLRYTTDSCGLSKDVWIWRPDRNIRFWHMARSDICVLSQRKVAGVKRLLCAESAESSGGEATSVC